MRGGVGVRDGKSGGRGFKRSSRIVERVRGKG